MERGEKPRMTYHLASLGLGRAKWWNNALLIVKLRIGFYQFVHTNYRWLIFEQLIEMTVHYFFFPWSNDVKEGMYQIINQVTWYRNSVPWCSCIKHICHVLWWFSTIGKLLQFYWPSFWMVIHSNSKIFSFYATKIVWKS